MRDNRGWEIDLENMIGTHENGMTMGFKLEDGFKVTGIIVNEPLGIDDKTRNNFYIGGCMSFIDVLKENPELH